MNYGEIKELVTFWVHRTDLDPIMDQIFELVRERIGKEARLLEMEFSAHLDYTGVDKLPLPLDFVEFRSVQANVAGGVRPLKVATKNQLEIHRNSAGGSPTHYSITDGNIEIGPGGDGASVDCIYVKRPSTLVGDSDTNEILTAHPSLYLYAAQMYIHNMAQDTESERVANENWGRELEAANESDDNARYSGDSPTMSGS